MNQCYGCTTCESADKPLEGYRDPKPMVYAGLFPIDLTIEWKVRAQNVLLDFKEYVVGFVQTDRAESHRMPREESAVQMQIRSLRETFFVR